MYRVQGELKIGGQISTLLMIKSLVCKSSLLVVQSQFCKKDPLLIFVLPQTSKRMLRLKVNKLETMFLCIYTKSNPSWFHLNSSLKTPRCTLVKTFQAYLIFQNQGCCPARLVVFGKVYPHFFMVPLIHKLILG